MHQCHLVDSDSHFMSVTNSNLTYETTFNFIQQHQIDKDGKLKSSSIYTSTALLEDQGTLVNVQRNIAFNLIFGIVMTVTPTYVVILCERPSSDGVKYEQYTVAYNTIIDLISEVLEYSAVEYRKTLEKLPMLLPEPHVTAYDLLMAFKCALGQNKDNPNKILYILYDGINSYAYAPVGIEVIKNVIYVDRISILPITIVNGFYFRDKDSERVNQRLEVETHD